MKIKTSMINRLLSEVLKENEDEKYEMSTKANLFLDRPTSHGHMDHEEKDWQGKGPVRDIIYNYLKDMGLVVEVKNIDEMAFKGHLGVSKDSGFDKLVSSDLENYRLDDLDEEEFNVSEEEFEDNYQDIIKSWKEKQRRSAEKYARSERFKDEAGKRLASFGNDIYIASHLGSFKTHFDEMKNNPGEIEAPGSIMARLQITDVNVGKKYLQADENFDKDTIDQIGDNDTIIYYSSVFIGSKQRLAQATPWMIFHAIFHDFSGNIAKISPVAKFLAANYMDNTYFSIRLKNINKVLTHKSARMDLKRDTHQPFQLSIDDFAEMICQDLLTKRGLVLKIKQEADPNDIDDWIAIKKIINKISQEVRANLPGKFIFVGVN